MKRYISIILIVGLMVAGIISSSLFGGKSSSTAVAADKAPQAGKDAKQDEVAAMAAQAPAVVVEKVIERKPVQLKKYVGYFEPIEKFVTLARVSGNIEELPFKEGDLIQKGAILFEIEKIRYQAALEASKAKIESIKAKIETLKAQQQQVKARLNYAQNNYDRNKELFDNGSVVAKDTVENAKSMLDGQTAEYKSFDAQLLAATAELHAAEADHKVVEDDLSHCTIKSEITGRAGRVNHTLGNYITPASGPMVTIVQMDPIYFRFSMSERDFVSMFGTLDNLKQSAKIKIELANGEFYTEEGEITFIDNQLQSTTNTLYIWATYKNSKEVLRPGGVATMFLSKEAEELRPAVKASAVTFDGSTHNVYIVGPNNIIEKRRVELGPTDGVWQVLTSGVQPGETVVTEGTHKIVIRPGADGKPMPFPVKPVWKSDTSATDTSSAMPNVNVAPVQDGGTK